MSEALRDVSNWEEENAPGLNPKKIKYETGSETTRSEKANTRPFKRGKILRSHPGLLTSVNKGHGIEYKKRINSLYKLM